MVDPSDGLQGRTTGAGKISAQLQPPSLHDTFTFSMTLVTFGDTLPNEQMPRGNSTSNWRIAAVVAVLACVMFVSVVPLSGNDFWLQVKLGELIAQQHSVPSTLLFPFTEIANKTFHAHEWLTSLAFYGLLRLFGEAGLPLVTGFLGVLLFAAMARLAYIRSGGHFALGLLGGLVTILSENYRQELRPELPALLLMAVFWNVLDAHFRIPRKRTAGLALLIVMMWANCHGSFILGPALVGIYTAGPYLDQLLGSHFSNWRPTHKFWHWLAFSLALVGVCLINPQGWQQIQFVLHFSNDTQAGAHLTEWIPTWDSRVHSLPGLWIGLGVWLLLVSVMLLNFRLLQCADALLFLFFSFLALKAIRFPVYLGMALAFIAPTYVRGYFNQAEVRPRVLQAITVVSLMLLLLAALFGNAAGRRPHFYDDPTKFTLKLTNAIANPQLRGNVLNSMELGSELIYRTYPRLRPAIDSRFDSYGDEYQDYLYRLLKNDTSFETFVTHYDVRYVLIDGSRYDDFIRLRAWNTGKWRVYSLDHRAVLFQRADVLEGSPVS